MNVLTIRDVDSNVAEKLRQEAGKQGKSVDQLALEFIKSSLGLYQEKACNKEYSDLDDLFGNWSLEEYQAIQGRIDQERTIDQDMWK